MNRRLAVVTVLAVVASTGACGTAPVSPLSVQRAGPSTVATTPPPTARPSPTRSPSARPSPKRSSAVTRPVVTAPIDPGPTGVSTCYGAVLHEIDLSNAVLELLPSLCFATGGVLRLKNVGPGRVTVAPKSLRSSFYAGGTVEIRWIRPGTATVTILEGSTSHDMIVVVR